MAVPSSGSLSLRRIAAEKVFDNYNITLDGFAQGTLGTTSLTDVSTSGNSNGSTPSFDATNTNSSSYPNGTTPHSMSEFYSYDHDASSSPSFSATMTVGNHTPSNDPSGNIYGYFIGYYAGFTGNIGSMSTTSFNNATIYALYWYDISGGRVVLQLSSTTSFNSITINGTLFSEASAANTPSTQYIWTNVSTNPFGTSGTITITASY